MDYSHIDDHYQAPATLAENSGHLIGIIVRVLGALLLIVGLLVALKVISEVWSLYRHPEGIEPLVVAIEKGSGLDKVLAPRQEHAQTTLPRESIPASTGVAGERASTLASKAAAVNVDDFRLAYFPAWFIAILMLLLIGRLAIAAIHTGGQLALYDSQMRRLIRALEQGRR